MNQATPAPRRPTKAKPAKRHAPSEHPHSVPILHHDNTEQSEFDASFDETPHDEYEPDLRQRMISEAAYCLFTERGYQDGYDIDDWIRAEEVVDRQLSSDRRHGER